MINELPGRDDLPPGVGLRDIDPPEPIKCESCGDPLERCDVEAGNTHCDFCLTAMIAHLDYAAKEMAAEWRKP